jgi:hypothetical protein
MSLSRDGQNARVWGYLTTGNYFQVLGVQAIRGRTFTAAGDLRPGAHPVAVLSYSSWQRRQGGDPEIGKTVRINGLTFTILGVMPPGFQGTELLYTPEIWVPMMMQPQIEPGSGWLDRRGSQNISSMPGDRPWTSP